MDLNSAKSLASLMASLIALSSTIYFWLIRANGEKAQLTVHPVSPMSGSVVTFFSDRATVQRMQPRDGEYCFKYWLNLAVVNNSSLPNALLGINVWLQLRTGAWVQMDVRSQEENQDLFPINLSSLTTASLKLALVTKLSEKIQDDNQGRAEAAGNILPDQIPIRIELVALQDKRFKREILDHGHGLLRTSQQTQSVVNAA